MLGAVPSALGIQRCPGHMVLTRSDEGGKQQVTNKMILETIKGYQGPPKRHRAKNNIREKVVTFELKPEWLGVCLMG